MQAVRIALVVSAAAAVCLFAGADRARAELRVIESSVAGVKKNATLPDGATFDVPEGKKIKLLKKPQNATYEIVGPYRGTLDGYQCGWWANFTGNCARGNVQDGVAEGGTRAAPVPGATRGLTPPKQ